MEGMWLREGTRLQIGRQGRLAMAQKGEEKRLGKFSEVGRRRKGDLF